MKVFIAGGTGLIGYHSALEFLKRGHDVSSISLPDIELGDWFPKEIEISYGNLFNMSKEELIELFSGQDALVYALGPDDRAKPPPPAYDFFYKYLVEACGRIVSAAKTAGVKKCVVLNSYFAYFDRVHPEWGLADHHPYIKCRVEQAKRVMAEGGGKMDVMVLELPYIFGSMPGRIPLWKDILVNMLIKNILVFYPRGGSSMISVKHVAEAVAGATEKGRNGKRYQIGDVNYSWRQMLKLMMDTLGKHKKILSPPCYLTALKGKQLRHKEQRHGIESGLNLSYIFEDILCREFYFDPSESSNELEYNRGGIDAAIEETVLACIK